MTVLWWQLASAHLRMPRAATEAGQPEVDSVWLQSSSQHGAMRVLMSREHFGSAQTAHSNRSGQVSFANGGGCTGRSRQCGRVRGAGASKTSKRGVKQRTVISKICTNCRFGILSEFLGVNVQVSERFGGGPPPCFFCSHSRKATLRSTRAALAGTLIRLQHGRSLQAGPGLCLEDPDMAGGRPLDAGCAGCYASTTRPRATVWHKVVRVLTTATAAWL